MFASTFAIALSAPVDIGVPAGHFIQLGVKSAHAKSMNAMGTGNGAGTGSENGGGGGNGGGNGGGPANGNGHPGGKGKGRTGDGPSAPGKNGQGPAPARPDAGVTVAQVTTAITRRHPANEVSALNSAHQPVSFYTEVHGMMGSEVTHLWYHGEDLFFESTFLVRADRWRVWSTHLLPAHLAGEWTLVAVNERNEVLAARELTYRPGGGAATRE